MPSNILRVVSSSFSLLLAAVAFSTLANAQIAPSDPPCGTSETIVTCSGAVTAGDMGQGVAVVGPPYDTLIIKDLSGVAIAPASGVIGIYFYSNTGLNFTVDSDVTGIPGIFASQQDALVAFSSLSASGIASGGDVVVTSDGFISASSNNRRGLVAISTINVDTVAPPGSAISSAKAGDAIVTNYGTIETGGYQAHGIQATSNGVSSIASEIGSGSTNAYTAKTNGGVVTVTNTGAVETAGDFAYGVFAKTSNSSSASESYGSGSTNAYTAVSNGGALTVANNGTIKRTVGNSGGGIRAEGSTNSDVYEDYGSGSNNSYNATTTGGAVTATNNGTIETAGNNVAGIVIYNSSSSSIFETNGLGSSGNTYIAAAHGAGTTLTNGGTIETAGDGAYGVYMNNFSSSFASQGDGSGASNNTYIATASDGAATVINSGTIETTGDHAHGITVSSTGESQSYEYSSSGSSNNVYIATANGGAVRVTNSGTIKVTGDSSSAIYATSTAHINGSNSSSATAGDVQITNSGDLTATGANSVAIEAQSLATGSGPLTNGNISIDVLSGTITGGGGSGSGIKFDDGAANSLTNRGSIQARSGLAVVGGNGNESIDNYGLLIGNVDLGGGANPFDNRLGGTFLSGASVNLGAGNTLTNEGTLSPGGAGVVQTTAFTGNFVQTNTGSFVVDLNGPTNDLVTITGTANFAGSVAPNIIDLSGPTGSAIIASASGITNTAAAIDTATTDFSLVVLDDDELQLVWQPALLANLLNHPLTQNQQATVTYIDGVTTAGAPPDLQALIDALKSQPSEAAIIAALDRLSPEHYLAQVEDSVQANLLFIDSMMSCPSKDGRPNYIYEGQCYWAKVSGRSFDWDRTNSNIGGDAEAWTVAGGIQVALSETMRLGFAGSYEHTDITTSNAASSEGDRGEGGVVLKDRWGNTSVAVAAFGGYGSFDTERFIGLDGVGTAEGDQGIAFGGMHARVSHLLDLGGWYLKPMVDVDAIYLAYGGFREHGGGAASLAVQGNGDWVLSARPAIEIGSEYKANDGSFVRPYLRIGGLFFDNNNFAMTSTFMSAPDGISPFSVTSRFDQSYFNVGAGIDLLTQSGVDVKLNYEGLFSGRSDANSGGLKVGVKF
jgi:hypothetical protein